MNQLVSIELNYEQAIGYLKRKDLQIETKDKGWQLVTYEGHSLGWINVLPNRINNYYPKELRILKDTITGYNLKFHIFVIQNSLS